MVTEHSATPSRTSGTVLTVEKIVLVVNVWRKTHGFGQISDLLISVFAMAGKAGVLARDVRPAKTPMLMHTSMPILSL